jgi:hypothetical protein
MDRIHGPAVHESIDCIELEPLNLGWMIQIERSEVVFSPSNLDRWLQNEQLRINARREAAALRASHGGYHCCAVRAHQREWRRGSGGFFSTTTTPTVA